MATSFTPMSKKVRKEDALEYHERGRPGKVEVVPTKPTATARDLSLAYTPGVAEPCLEIHRDQDLSYKYTARGNLVAVVTNGTAVLGLGDIGPWAAKPVMEGKGVLFKRFADIDVFDINLNAHDIETFCTVVKALEPTFGGINLEDVKAPDCFIIEERLKKEMQIPIFHDDQHGTAIISGAALLNAAELVQKPLDKLKVVVSGAGASAIACTNFFLQLGVKRENVMLCDTKGVLHKGRTDGLNPWKEPYVRDTRCRTLAEALEGADVFLGASVKGVVNQEMLKRMAPKPIIFALANPDPEIGYQEAKEARPDAVVATGRSDYPNQVNNVLGFPFIFRGALDVRAKAINEEMKMAAARALAAMARENVPESVSRAYGGERFIFGPDYIIPKPFDTRALLWVAPAVARAAMDSGVARHPIDLEQYKARLAQLLSRSNQVMGSVMARAKKRVTRLAFAEGEQSNVLQAARILREEQIAEPVLVGNRTVIEGRIAQLRLEPLQGVNIVDPAQSPQFESYAQSYWKMRQRRGISLETSRAHMLRLNYFACMMLQHGDVDGLVMGGTRSYPESIRPPFEIIRTRPGQRAGGVYVVITRNDFKFFADCTVHPNPDAEALAEIAVATADLARYFDVTPRLAMLSYSNFGDADGDSPRKMRQAMELVRKMRPELEVEGEMQVDAALLEDERSRLYPFSKLTGDANVLIFPDLDAANIAYKLVWRLGGAEVVGPILLGMNKPVNVLQQDSSVEEIVNLAAVTAARAQGGELVF
jgi:malate dehydrogenase (oxaloacetate-decarboxylating)(NADP+)